MSGRTYENAKLGISLTLKENLLQKDLELFEIEFNKIQNPRSGRISQLGSILRAAKSSGWIVSSNPVVESRKKVPIGDSGATMDVDPVGDMSPIVVKAFGIFIDDLYIELTTIPND